MATILSINKENEKIVIPVEDGDDVVLSVNTSDKNIETVLHKVGNAISKFQTLSKNIELATGDEDVEQAKDALVNLMKRTISAIVGKEGWEDILSFIGDGTPVDPKREHHDAWRGIRGIGDVALRSLLQQTAPCCRCLSPRSDKESTKS